MLFALVAVLAASSVGAGAAVTTAHPAAARASASIRVLNVSGLIDPVIVTAVTDAVEQANRVHATMLVLQINSGGGLDADVSRAVRAIRRSAVPVVAWVGPTGSEAPGAAALLVEASHVAFIAPGSTIGPVDPVLLDDPDATSRLGALGRTRRLVEGGGRDADHTARLVVDAVPAVQAARLGLVDGVRPTFGEVVVTLDGETVTTRAGDVELSTAKVVGEGRDRRRRPNQDVVFESLGLGPRIQHALISPSLAYALAVIGLSLLVFEFFTISIGIAGTAGALAVVGAGYGFSHLPLTWWGAALLVLAMLGYAIDVQAGGVGPWTAIGTVALVAGSIGLYGGSDRLGPAWWAVLIVTLLVILFFVGGMTSMLRSRFTSPIVGREGMIGAIGVADGSVAPDGVVVIDGARWRANTSRVTPLADGDAVRVVAVRGLVLEVEPQRATDPGAV